MSYQKWLADPESQRLLRQEGLILSVTESIWQALTEKEWTKADLAEKLGVSRSHVTQLLSGQRNMTMRTLADIADALDLTAMVCLIEKDRCSWQGADSFAEHLTYRSSNKFSLTPVVHAGVGYSVDDNVIHLNWSQAA